MRANKSADAIKMNQILSYFLLQFGSSRYHCRLPVFMHGSYVFKLVACFMFTLNHVWDFWKYIVKRNGECVCEQNLNLSIIHHFQLWLEAQRDSSNFIWPRGIGIENCLIVTTLSWERELSSYHYAYDNFISRDKDLTQVMVEKNWWMCSLSVYAKTIICLLLNQNRWHLRLHKISMSFWVICACVERKLIQYTLIWMRIVLIEDTRSLQNSIEESNAIMPRLIGWRRLTSTVESFYRSYLHLH